MKLSELKKIVDEYVKMHQDYDDPEIRIVISSHNSVGGTPTVGVKNMYCGFDWDAGKMMIFTDKPVMRTDQKSIEELRKEAEKLGWDMYENRNLKAEVKRLRAKVKDLTPE